MLVFEDDVVLCEGFKARLDVLELPNDWMVCYLGCVFHDPPEVLSEGLLRVRGKTWDAHAYLIRKPFWEAMHQEFAKVSRRRQRITDASESPGGAHLEEERSNDVIMAEFHDRFPAYAVWPPMAWQVQGLSNNENSVRGNYLPDGTQSFGRRAILHLPGMEAERMRSEVRRVPLELVSKQRAGGGIKIETESPEKGRWILRSAEGLRPAYEARVSTPWEGPVPSRGFLVSPYSADSERMAYALVRSLRCYNPWIPVCVLGQDYVCGLDWRGLAKVRSVRAAEAHGTEFQWFNKLSALERAPFEETIYLDCDIVFLDDPADWFERLGTDDFTWFQRRWSVETIPDEMLFNFVNPHRMREEFGVTSVPVIDGSGHFFLRKSDRSRMLLQQVVDIMVEAVETPATSLYRRMTGEGNVAASDEAAASIVAVRENIRLPEVIDAPCKPVGIYLPPHHRDGVFDFARGIAQYRDSGDGTLVTPQSMHFCWMSKSHPAYRQYIAECLELSVRKRPLAAV